MKSLIFLLLLFVILIIIIIVLILCRTSQKSNYIKKSLLSQKESNNLLFDHPGKPASGINVDVVGTAPIINRGDPNVFPANLQKSTVIHPFPVGIDGKPVDWWLIYIVPGFNNTDSSAHGETNSTFAAGEWLYYDSVMANNEDIPIFVPNPIAGEDQHGKGVFNPIQDTMRQTFDLAYLNKQDLIRILSIENQKDSEAERGGDGAHENNLFCMDKTSGWFMTWSATSSQSMIGYNTGKDKCPYGTAAFDFILGESYTGQTTKLSIDHAGPNGDMFFCCSLQPTQQDGINTYDKYANLLKVSTSNIVACSIPTWIIPNEVYTDTFGNDSGIKIFYNCEKDFSIEEGEAGWVGCKKTLSIFHTFNIDDDHVRKMLNNNKVGECARLLWSWVIDENTYTEITKNLSPITNVNPRYTIYPPGFDFSGADANKGRGYGTMATRAFTLEDQVCKGVLWSCGFQQEPIPVYAFAKSSNFMHDMVGDIVSLFINQKTGNGDVLYQQWWKTDSRPFICKGVVPPVETRLGAFKNMNWSPIKNQIEYPTNLKNSVQNPTILKKDDTILDMFSVGLPFHSNYRGILVHGMIGDYKMLANGAIKPVKMNLVWDNLKDHSKYFITDNDYTKQNKFYLFGVTGQNYTSAPCSNDNHDNHSVLLDGTYGGYLATDEISKISCSMNTRGALAFMINNKPLWTVMNNLIYKNKNPKTGKTQRYVSRCKTTELPSIYDTTHFGFGPNKKWNFVDYDPASSTWNMPTKPSDIKKFYGCPNNGINTPCSIPDNPDIPVPARTSVPMNYAWGLAVGRPGVYGTNQLFSGDSDGPVGSGTQFYGGVYWRAFEPMSSSYGALGNIDGPYINFGSMGGEGARWSGRGYNFGPANTLRVGNVPSHVDWGTKCGIANQNHTTKLGTNDKWSNYLTKCDTDDDCDRPFSKCSSSPSPSDNTKLCLLEKTNVRNRNYNQCLTPNDRRILSKNLDASEYSQECPPDFWTNLNNPGIPKDKVYNQVGMTNFAKEFCPILKKK